MIQDQTNATPQRGERFNTYNGNASHAGPQYQLTVPDAPTGKSLHYDIANIISPAKLNQIHSSGILAFQCIGDTGNDHSAHHHGGPVFRQAVADWLEAECVANSGKDECPLFCYHVGDLIYDHSFAGFYEEEFYRPYKNYGNAIVAIPGNHDNFDNTANGLDAFKQNFLQPSLGTGHRPAMNLPWFYWVLDTPVATIIGLAAIDNAISTAQQTWFNNEMKSADSGKALIVAVHYPPYSFDGYCNHQIQDCLDNAFETTGKVPDLLLSGHSHNYQRIQVDANQTNGRPGYTAIINGAGGVSVGGLKSPVPVNGTTLATYNDTEYGALTVIVNNSTKKIACRYTTAISASGKEEVHQRDQFLISY